MAFMACCRPCCGCADCEEGGQGKCCCGGAEGTCCQEGEYCCNGVCEPGPCCETTEDCPEGYECVNGVCEEICDPPADPNACEECVDGVVVSFCSESEVCCDGVCQECCDDGDCGEGFICVGGGCEASCDQDTDCDPCSCCVDGYCQEADPCPTPTVDSAAWNGNTGNWGMTGCSPGSTYCPDDDTNYIFTTFYFFLTDSVSLIETVPCDATTQDTSPGSFPAKPAGVCRYIYRCSAGFGQDGTGIPAGDCHTKYWWGYLDVDPCAPTGGTLAMIEDTASEVINSLLGDCVATPKTGGCVDGCDTDVDGYFSTPPSIYISFPP